MRHVNVVQRGYALFHGVVFQSLTRFQTHERDAVGAADDMRQA